MPQHLMSSEELGLVPVEMVVPAGAVGFRLDAFLAEQFPRYSRVLLRRAIGEAGVTVDGRRTKPAYRLRGGERVSIVLPELPREVAKPEDIPLDVLYEDDSLAVINKPAGMVVHPARGHWKGTLASALAFHFERLSTAGGAARPGIIHRLDRDTSGALIVAKTDFAHMHLAEQFERRTVEKEYFAIVAGVPNRDRDLVSQPIGPHPYQREKMAIRPDYPQRREAQTFFEVTERFDGFAALCVLPKTGRTHQIRLHLGHIGCPVLCDRLYGGRAQITRGELRRDPSDAAPLLERQALHARRLKIVHPHSGESLTVEAPLPADMAGVLDELRRWRAV